MPTAKLLDDGDLSALFPFRVVGASSLLEPRVGERPSTTTGLGYDFADYQRYRPGDRIEHVDWRRWFLTDGRDCFVRKFYEELTTETAVILDASASMDTYPGDEKFDRARQLALAALHMAVNGYDLGDLVVLGGAGGRVDPVTGLRSWPRVHSSEDLAALERDLDRTRADGTDSFEGVITSDLALRRHYGAIVLLSDLFSPPDDLSRLIGSLAERTTRLHVIHLVGKHDREPLPGRQDVVWIDAETGFEQTWFYDSQEHGKRVSEVVNIAREICLRHEATYVRLDPVPGTFAEALDLLEAGEVLEVVR